MSTYIPDWENDDGDFGGIDSMISYSQEGILVAAYDSPELFKSLANYVVGSGEDAGKVFQTVLAGFGSQGGIIRQAPGTYVFEKNGVATTPPQGYSVLIDQNDGPVIWIGSGWNTVNKLKANQDANTCMILVRGDSGDKRTAQTRFSNMLFDGNYTNQVNTWTDFALVEGAYADNVRMYDCKMQSLPYLGVRLAFRESKYTGIYRCHFDVTNGKKAVRAEGADHDIIGCTFWGDYTVYEAVIDLACNADISVPGENLNVCGNRVYGGAYPIVAAGLRHTKIHHNWIYDCLNLNTPAIQVTAYNGAVKYGCFDVSISNNHMVNVRNGIKLVTHDVDPTLYVNYITMQANQIWEGSGVSLVNGIEEQGSFTDYNWILDNLIYGATTPVTTVGANTVVRTPA